MTIELITRAIDSVVNEAISRQAVGTEAPSDVLDGRAPVVFDF